MKFLKYFLLTALIHGMGQCSQAQTTGKTSYSNYMSGVNASRNYVLNPDAEVNTQNVTVSGTGATIVTASGLGFFNTKNFRVGGSPGNTIVATVAIANYDTALIGNGANCTTSYWLGINSNGVMTVNMKLGSTVVGTQTIDASLTGTPLTPYTISFVCGATSQTPTLEFSYAAAAGSSANLFEFDDVFSGAFNGLSAIPQGSRVIGTSKQVGAAGCYYSETTSSGITNFVALGTGTGCNAWTTAGSVTPVGTNDHRQTLASVAPGFLKIMITGTYENLAAGSCIYRISDGTNTYDQQTIYNSGATIQGPQLEFVIPYATNQGSTTYTLQAADDQASGCRVVNASTAYNMSWTFEWSPLSSAGYANVVPASCINNPDCQNVFSAKIGGTGTVTDENYSFINGNCTNANPFVCTWDTNRFSVAPTCVITPSNAATQAQMTASSTTSGSVSTYNAAGSATQGSFNIVCTRAGTDVKPWGPIPYISGMVSTDGTTNWKAIEGTVSNNGTTCTTSLSSGGIQSVTRNGTGRCDFVAAVPFGTVASPYATCTCSMNFTYSNGNAVINCYIVPTSATAFSIYTFQGTNLLDLSAVVGFRCGGPR